MSSEGFKETEIGLIPEGWKLKAFSDIVDIIGGGTPKTTMEEYWEGEIPWLSVVDFNNEFRTVNETEKSITEMGLNNSSTKILKKGELIISARGTVGAIAQLGRDMAFNQSCYGLRAMKTMTDNDFIYYLLKYSLNILKQTTHGSTFDTITKNTFDLLKVPLPPMKEQIKIASILSVLDDKIELNHRMNQTLEAIGQAIFRHWFVHFEFPNSEGQPYKSSGGEMVDSELGEIPKGWEIKP
ncbi:MAG: restriction endonuclease subunit S [Methanobacterium sp.]